MAGSSTQVVRVINVGNMARGLPIMFNALPGIVGTPGPQGPPGPGSYTNLENPFTVPNPGASVNVTVQNTEWMVGGASVYVQNAGYYKVQSVFDATHATLLNTNAPGNASPGVIIPSPQGVSAAGAQGAQGIQGQIGPVGPQGATGPQGTGINYRGTWSASANYAVNDSVTYGGSSYVALKTSLNVIPGTDPTTWGIFAAQGATGAQGAPGAQGPAGQIGATGPAGPACTALTSAQFTQPAVNASVTVPVTQTSWCPAGSVVFIAGGGYYEVISVPDSTHLVLNNPGWTDAASPGTVIPSGALVTAGGVEGAQGNNGAPGAVGPQGPAGTPGARAYSITGASFVVPMTGAAISITVDSTAWMTVGANIYIPGAGYYQIATIGGATLLTATNLGYQGNASAGTTIASGAYVYAGGAPMAANREYYKTDFENGWPDWTLTSGSAIQGGQLDADSQGIVALACAAASGSSFGFRLGNATSTVQVGYRTAYFHAKFQVPQLATSADSFGFYFGWFDALPTGPFQNGVFFYYSNSGSTPNDWGCFCRRAGAQVFSDSGVAVQTGYWYDLEVTVDAVYATFSIASYAQGATPAAPVQVAQIAISQCPAPGVGLGPVMGASKLSGTSVSPSIYADCYDHEIQYQGVAKFRQPAMIGPAGKNSTTGTTANFITPSIGSNVLVSVGDTTFMSPGMQLYIAGAGTYQVSSITSPTQVSLINTGASGNAAPSTLVSAGAGVTVSGVAGPQGVQGPLGPVGPIGQGAYTALTNSFIQPSLNATVNVAVTNSNWMGVGMTIYIASGGYYIVTAVPNPQNITVTNPGYSGNVAPGSTVLNGSQVSSGGTVGPAGVDPAIVGSVMQWCAAGIPQGWLMADGSAVSRTVYPQLYAALGGASSPWGQGDGASTFNLPDLRGRTLIGSGQGSGLTSRVLGTVGGAEMHTMTLLEMVPHNHGLNWQDNGHTHPDPGHTHPQSNHAHGITDYGHSHGYNTPANLGPPGWGATNTPGNAMAAYQTGVSVTNIQVQGAVANIGAATCGLGLATSGISASVQSAGGLGGAAQPFNLMNPWAAINYIIKAAYNAPVGPTVPLADTTQPGLVTKMSGLSTDYIGGDNATHSLAGAMVSVMPNARSYNALGNSTFEIDARTVAGGTNTGGAFALDRWIYQHSGAAAGTAIQNLAPTGVIVAGGTFCISQNFLRYTLTTQEGTLGATDYTSFGQFIEGQRLRELLGGQTSVTIVARSSVAGTTFTVALRDANNAYSIVQLGTLTNANAWYAIQLPAFALWTPSGTFNVGPGVLGYILSICIAAGSNYVAGSTNSWLAGNFAAAPAQGNFCANPINSTFDLGYALHEPGPTCNGILDKGWQDNQRECERYFQKSTAYTNKPLQGNWKQIGQLLNATTTVRSSVQFPTRMAKAPAMTWVGNSTVTGNVYVDTVGLCTVASSVSDTSGVSGVTLNAAQSPGHDVPVMAEWTADTGW